MITWQQALSSQGLLCDAKILKTISKWRVHITRDVQRALKSYCAQRGLTLENVTESIISKFLRENVASSENYNSDDKIHT